MRPAESIVPFIEFLSQWVTFSAREQALLAQHCPVVEFAKGDILLAEGQTSQAFYFNMRGCTRMYYLVDGEEKNTFFYTEDQFISSYESFVHQRPAQHYLQCLEDSTMVRISLESTQRLLQASPAFDKLARILMEDELIIYQRMLASFITMNAEQRYQELLDRQTDLLQRITLYHLSSYLGVNPETLSRIRKRIADRRGIS